jgi:hypothetical protein
VIQLDQAIGLGMRDAEAEAPRRTALLMGAGGRLGERMLDQLLGQPAYDKVYAWSRQPVSGTVLKLVCVETPDALRADDVYCVVGIGDDHLRRTEVYHTVAETEVLDLARRVLANGAQRFILVTPISAFSQPAALHNKLQNIAELELAALPFEVLLVVRPSTWGMARPQEGWFARMVRGAIDQITNSMAGKRNMPMTAQRVAEVTVAKAVHASRGLTILEPDQLRADAVRLVEDEEQEVRAS